MNNEKGSKPNYGSPNMMDTIKTNIMTMMMINGSKSGTGDNGAMTMVYLFVVTQVLDFLMKMLPFLVQRFEKVYNDKIKSMKELAEASISITSMKYKTSSITINVALKDQENETGQALLDYTTNSCYTKHISFRNKIFVLNQTDPIEIYKDIFVVMKESLNTSDDDNDSNETNQNVELYSYELTIEKLREFLEELKTKYIIRKKNKLGNNRYYFNLIPIPAFRSIENQKDYSKLPENFVFSMKKFQTNRKFSNLFGEDIDIIRKRVNFFMNNKDWYNEKGIPYTLGLLLSGSPGTGKTSTIKCLTNETNRHIININLNNDITKRQFENLFYNETIHILNTSTRQNETYCIPFDERLYVFEDVDCQSDVVNKRSDIEENPVTVDIKKKGVKHDKKEEIDDSLKIDLSFLLNLLDGVLETPGRIIIMTSNYPDMLDEALIRPGRIDVKAKFKKCSISTIIKMLEFFYNTKLTDEFNKIINEFKPESLTPAELGKIMFENVDNIENAVRILQTGSEVIIDKNNLNDSTRLITDIPKNQDDEYNYGNETRFDETSIIKTMEIFYNTTLTDKFKRIIMDDVIAESLSPTDLEKIMLDNVDNIENAIRMIKSSSDRLSNYIINKHKLSGKESIIKQEKEKGSFAPYCEYNDFGISMPYTNYQGVS